MRFLSSCGVFDRAATVVPKSWDCRPESGIAQERSHPPLRCARRSRTTRRISVHYRQGPYSIEIHARPKMAARPFPKETQSTTKAGTAARAREHQRAPRYGSREETSRPACDEGRWSPEAVVSGARA